PLFSKTFGGGAVQITEENVRDIPKVQEAGKIAIIGLHGSLDSDYTITETDVFDKEYKILEGEFHSALHTAGAFVFIGYSMSDPDFRRIYMEYRQEITGRGEAKKSTCFVAPAKDEFSYRLGSVIWRRRGAVWIPFDATEFFAVLRRFLERRESKRIREAILKKYGHAPEDNEAFDDLVQRTADILKVERSDAVAFLYATRTRTGGAE
ncbi:MAG: SIR2 family protein, partial [Candidatus Latescibacterota bacterium]